MGIILVFTEGYGAVVAKHSSGCLRALSISPQHITSQLVPFLVGRQHPSPYVNVSFSGVRSAALCPFPSWQSSFPLHLGQGLLQQNCFSRPENVFLPLRTNIYG